MTVLVPMTEFDYCDFVSQTVPGYAEKVASGERPAASGPGDARAPVVHDSGLGLSGIALHVFGHNLAAQALYRKIGYTPTDVNMFKAIGNATVAACRPGPNHAARAGSLALVSE